MDYLIYFDIAALIVILTIGLQFLNKKTTIVTRQTEVFVILLVVAAFSTVFDIITVLLYPYSLNIPMWFNYLINELYLITFNATAAIYYLYVVISIRKNKPLTKMDEISIVVPISIDVILVILTPLTKQVFYFSESGAYMHGPLIYLLYLVALYYVGVSLTRTKLNSSILTRNQRRSVYFYTLSSLFAILFQMFYPQFLILEFVVSISVLLIYLSLENPTDYIDKQLEIYNRYAFNTIASIYFEKEEPFEAMGITVEGLQNVRQVFGVTGETILLKQIASFLSNKVGDKAFYLSNQEFTILDRMPKKRWDELIYSIHQRFDEPFFINGAEVTLSVYMGMIAYPHNVKRLEDINDYLEHSIEQAVSTHSWNPSYLTEKEIEPLRRKEQIKQILVHALRNNEFRVYYQPIYSVEKQCYTSAEALIRLYTEEYGFISPDEFIPVAEETGLMLEIGRYVYREVCRFMKEEKIWEKGIEYIDVNLSAVQCMQESLYEELLEIMNEFELPYTLINLEITETAAVLSSSTLKRNMENLMKHQMSFSLDDYGTGFSNMDHLINYPFHTIKLDKTMLWTAMTNIKAMMALKHTIAMIKDMDMNIVAEGVETKEQVDLLTELKCDFFQGYYYSKAVPDKEFVELLSK